MLKLKPEELTRENSVTWLRAELLRQVNSVGAPVPIHDIYFQQFVVM
jgi:flagellar basal body-associated protein FliL